jgi:hypothetical protein
VDLKANWGRIVAGMSSALLLILVLALGLATAEEKKPMPFLDDAKFGYQFRTTYFDRQSSGDSTGAGSFHQQAVGLGGWLYGNTGEIGKILSFGATYNFTIPLYGPSDNPYNYVLRDPGQDSVSVIGEANAKLRFGNHAIVLGRQSINNAWYMEDVVRYYNKLDQSMIGRRDVRAMQWLQYEAATVKGRFNNDTLRYYGGYVWNMRQINDNSFRNLYQAAYQTTVWPDSEKTGYSNGLAYAGVQWKPGKNTMLEGSYYVVQDMMNMTYVDFDHVFRLAEKNYVRLGVQFMNQSGNGANLVTAGRDFNTNYWGAYVELRLLSWLVPYAMAGKTSDGEDIRSPFAIGPSYLVQRIGENSKAGERTWIIGGLFDFGPAGLKGLQFDINYGRRTDRHTVIAAANTDIDKLPTGLLTNRNTETATSSLPATDWDELATDLIYTFAQDGFFKNLRLRARYAKVWENGAGLIGEKTQNDLRFDIGLNIPFN